jgi:hypothetical protein
VTEESLKDYLDGFHAYDCGCLDSGIRDDVKRAEIGEQLMSMPTGKRVALLDRFGQEMYGHEPYAEEDLDEWDEWVREQGWK